MQLLVLGGTEFAGRHIVELALERGHTVTIFHRGLTGTDLFPAVERVLGERSGDLAGLAGRPFDAVIDTSGYLPDDVRRSATLLSETAGRYLFVSTRSVYAAHETPGQDEDAPLAELAPGAAADTVTPDTYGPLKALCERAVEDAFPGRATILRPGLIVGPHDPTGRFAYWPERIAGGGDVLVPAPPGQPIQVIDARDLAAFALDLLAAGTAGVFNVVTPDGMLTLESVFEACRDAAKSDARPVWVAPDFLLERGVEPWSEVPLWTPWPDHAGFQRGDVSSALAHGLQVRPIEETAADTLRWIRATGVTADAALAADREAALLAEWRAQL